MFSLKRGKAEHFCQKDKKYRISLATCGEIYYTDIEFDAVRQRFSETGAMRLATDEIGARIRAGTVAVLGLGISNFPLVKKLVGMGARVTVHDQKSVAELGAGAAELERAGVRFVTGEGYLDHLDEDVIFRSPGIRPDAGGIPAALARGACLTSEMEWFMELTPATVIGVTGSDGKTTTTTVTALMLEKACERRGYGKTYVGGNIGQSLLPLAEQMTKEDFAVVELSSFQLMTMRHSPRAVGDYESFPQSSQLAPGYGGIRAGKMQHLFPPRRKTGHPQRGERLGLPHCRGNGAPRDLFFLGPPVFCGVFRADPRGETRLCRRLCP